ncbi:MAG: polysulfide reductase NrfD [Chloroflexota bacterium]|nr:polysulfide reductase NrfD [Chloroflexota bacterium]
METFERRWTSDGSRKRGGPEAGDPARPHGRSAADEARGSYYGVPVIHRPHWHWLIVVYFFLGGIAGACYAIASVAQLVGPKEDQRLVRAGRYLSFATLLPSPVLLILDLGRPERFFKMLRVLKLRSPMSVGTWGLTVFGAFAALSAAVQAAEDGLLGAGRAARTLAGWPAKAIGAAGLPWGLFVAGYTGVLLGVTAVPLWAKNALLLGPLFLASAFSTAASAISLALSVVQGTERATLERLERLERVAIGAELGLLAASSARLGTTAAPVKTGTLGALLRYGTVGSGLLLPLGLHAVVRVLGEKSRRRLGMLSSTLVLLGGFLLRYTTVVGGKASADDPQSTFDFARQGPDPKPRVDAT